MTTLLIVTFICGLIASLSATNCPDRWVAYAGSCYLFGHDTVHFTEAEEYCRHHGAHLIHVDSAEENNFIKGYLMKLKRGNYWLGMMDETIEGIWKWYDTDTKVTYTNWNSGEPNNAGNEDCAALQGEEGYRWADFSCKATQKALCETSFGSLSPFG